MTETTDAATSEASLTFDELIRTVNSYVDTHVDARTIRYWRSIGLLSAPNGAGRGARWQWRHVLEASYIRSRQSDGATLADLGAVPATAEAELAAATSVPAHSPADWSAPGVSAFWDTSSPETAIAGGDSATAVGSATLRRSSVGAADTRLMATSTARRVLIELPSGAAVALDERITSNPGVHDAITSILDELDRAVTNLTETHPC